MQLVPHLLVVALVTLVTSARLGCGRRLSGERSGGCVRPIGEEIGYRSRHYICFLKTPPGLTGVTSKRREELWGAQRTGGRMEARLWRVTAAYRVRCGGSVRKPAATVSGVKKNPTLQVHVGSKEALPHKKRTAVSWPRRDRMGLRLHRGAFSHGGSRSYGDRVYPHRMGYCRRRGWRPRLCSSGNIE